MPVQSWHGGEFVSFGVLVVDVDGVPWRQHWHACKTLAGNWLNDWGVMSKKILLTWKRVPYVLWKCLPEWKSENLAACRYD